MRPAGEASAGSRSDEGPRDAPVILDIPVQNNETCVPAYSLPDPLVMADGRPVTNRETWRERRAEILRLFERHVYGVMPAPPETMTCEERARDDQALEGRASRIEVTLRLKGAGETISIHVLMFIPADAKHPAPAFLGFNYLGNQTVQADPAIAITHAWVPHMGTRGIVDHRATEGSRGARARRWPIERILERGYAVVTAYYGDIVLDQADLAQDGLATLRRMTRAAADPGAECGAIGAWAWGLARILDFLPGEGRIDNGRVAVFGHSRLAKAALWAGACDERFALVIANNSGHGGAALTRRTFGETIEHLNLRFPHWFCEDFRRFHRREQDLPVDQHLLLSAIAPRPLYVASASEDLWSDPRGEFLAALHADPVYRLLDAQGLATNVMPAPDTRAGETIGYHLRTGRHDLTHADWEHFLAFADQQMMPSS
ncbi:MAG: acetylxylan esterase [Vicinamibacteria bacterium]|nr:acetylxylan esterase [Vicinamibacteria bacterium]